MEKPTKPLKKRRRDVEEKEDGVPDLIQQLEIEKNELAKKIRHIEKMCNMADPITVLQGPESDGSVNCGTEGEDNEDGETEDEEGKSPALANDLDCKSSVYGQQATGMELDVGTASSLVVISEDGKTVSFTRTDQRRPLTPKRFQDYAQALCTRKFTSGRHYWEIEGSELGYWWVGVSYATVEKGGDLSSLGNNSKSWCLYRWNYKYSVRHNGKVTDLILRPYCGNIRILLDYDAGHLTFYELSDPMRHLHTFTATFTEPLHAAFRVWGDDAWVKIVS
ncbi:tripartite motif-containing protein 14 [Xenopus laevis]|uniref:Tripartite motif-containing protein 14 n=1 Tax=Xenopus laevis TaxID=8355 RepID=A0A8J0TXD5_XENLA|nr:tripartite motif-containing protein 14 [Xenopus laevis]OCT57688.1 hypothetical protein XELAEV_18003146mg [Xenopus laevis]